MAAMLAGICVFYCVCFVTSHGMWFVTSQDRRSKLMGELKTGLPSILAMIKSALSSETLPAVLGALKCLTSWVNVRTGIVTPDDIGEHVTVILSMIAVPDVREAVSAWTALVRACDSAG